MENKNSFNLDLEFDLEKNKSSVIKVIGVGGGGGNAVNYMYQKGIKDVDFVVINTDAQDLSKSPIPNKIQIGKSLTEGLGAGANPEVGERAALEDLKAIENVLETNTKMIFITAGMGGGTGTGAAPIIAKLAKEMGILTVGIVTSPFMYEGKKRNDYAAKGIENLREYVDSLIIINNNKLREIYGNLTYKEAFAKSDMVLASAATSIAEVITHNYTINVDFRDVRTVLENSGTAIMGAASASGESRAKDVIAKALDSPLLNDNKITGAKNVLLLIVSGSSEITIDEISEINDYIQTEAGHSADIIMGIGEDASSDEEISVTIIATGFNKNQQNMIANTEQEKIVHVLDDETASDLDMVQDVITNYETPIETEEHAEIDEFGYKQFKMSFYDEPIVENPTEFIDESAQVENKIELINKDISEHLQEEIQQEAEKKQDLLFNLNEKQSKEVIEEQDPFELPIEEVFRKGNIRKNYMRKYTSHLDIEDENKEVPAFQKKGIEIDLSPKSSQTTHKIEMNMDGEFKLKDSNSFLNDNVD